MASLVPKLTLNTISKAFTEEVLLVAVRKALKKDDVMVSSHKVWLGTDKGNGYISIVYRITVELNDGRTLSLVAKGLPADLVCRSIYDSTLFFQKEVAFYTQYAPLLKDFEVAQRGAEAVAADTFLPIAECYYAMADGANDFLVFQDLKELGFGMADRINGPTELQRNGMLSTLARYHALSIALQVLEPEKFEPLRRIHETWYSKDKAPKFAGYMHKMFLLWHRAIKDGLAGTECLRRFEALGPDPSTLSEKICNALRVIEPCVVTHGDCWSTNFMFKDDQVAVIDFQMPRYCSGMSDVSIYVFSCTTEQQRAAAGGTTSILKNYFNILDAAVKELGVKENLQTWEGMMQQWKVNGLNGLFCAFVLVPLTLAGAADIKGLDRIEGDEPIDLVQFFPCKDITNLEGKQRLIDVTKTAMEYEMI